MGSDNSKPIDPETAKELATQGYQYVWQKCWNTWCGQTVLVLGRQKVHVQEIEDNVTDRTTIYESAMIEYLNYNGETVTLKVGSNLNVFESDFVNVMCLNKCIQVSNFKWPFLSWPFLS